MAKMSFFEFLRSPMGVDLYRMLSLEYQPGPDDWERHAIWWNDCHERLRIELNKRGAFEEYHEFVAWRSQLFMNTYWQLVAKVSQHNCRSLFT